MTEQQKLPSPEYYQLRVKGQLDPRWSEWFELTISHEADGRHPLGRAGDGSGGLVWDLTQTTRPKPAAPERKSRN